MWGQLCELAVFFNIKKIFLVGYSAKYTTPGGNVYLNPKIKKSALGSQNDLEVVFVDSLEKLAKIASLENFDLIGVEQSDNAAKLSPNTKIDKAILVFGNEVDGISKESLKICRQTLEINRLGKHNSLNVATAVGIVLYQLTQKH